MKELTHKWVGFFIFKKHSQVDSEEDRFMSLENILISFELNPALLINSNYAFCVMHNV
jgi:hypothetical protein